MGKSEEKSGKVRKNKESKESKELRKSEEKGRKVRKSEESKESKEVRKGEEVWAKVRKLIKCNDFVRHLNCFDDSEFYFTVLGVCFNTFSMVSGLKS